MHYRAVKVTFRKDVTIDVLFQDGKIIRYDLSKMFTKYPQLKKLREDRGLFMMGHIDEGGYGIIWNDDLDFDATSIYLDGELVGQQETSLNQRIGYLLAKTREEQNITQTELAKISKIDQGDISKIEKGIGNPTIGKINKLFKSLGKVVNLTLL